MVGRKSLMMSLPYAKGASTASSPRRRGAARLAISLYAGFFVYCALSFAIGPAGIAAYRRLEERKAAMETNLAELGTIRQGLNAELDSLKNDPDRAAREARSLGYLRKGETAIVLGEKVETVRPIDAGKVLPYADPVASDDAVLKEISIGVFLAVLALLLAPRSARTRPEGRKGHSFLGPKSASGTAWSRQRPERSRYPQRRRLFRSR